MGKVKFNVSSKTARLIGRENISDSNGAIIELIKNAYDADAENAYIQFDIQYEDVPKEINKFDLRTNFVEDEIEIIKNDYKLEDNKYIKKDNLSEEELEKLKSIFFSRNQIIIVDDGTGMDEDIIKNVWMNIGTDDKEAYRLDLKKGAWCNKKNEKHPMSKKVNQYTLENKYIKTWESASEIKRQLGISVSSISQCCGGINKSAGGYIWRYE